MKKTVNIVIFALLLLIFGSYMFTFQVRQDQIAFVDTFGKTSEPIVTAGLKYKWPWPIQRVYTFDKRIHLKTTDYTQITTGQGSLIVQAYFCWRINNPSEFMKKAKGSTAEERRRNAEDNLEREIKDAISEVFGGEENVTDKLKVDDIIDSESGNVTGEARHTFEKLEKQIFELVKGAKSEQYGMELTIVGIRRVGISQNALVAVLDTMVTQWTNKAFSPVQEAENKAKSIRDRAINARETALETARNEASRIISSASEKEAIIFSKMEKEDARLAELLLKLSTMEKVLGKESTLLLDENVPFLEAFSPKFFAPIPVPDSDSGSESESGSEPESEK
jgi:regulator of protease activity HflC (stomatin/prohibitin superfamily)